VGQLRPYSPCLHPHLQFLPSPCKPEHSGRQPGPGPTFAAPPSRLPSWVTQLLFLSPGPGSLELCEVLHTGKPMVHPPLLLESQAAQGSWPRTHAQPAYLSTMGRAGFQLGL
jgi:hypothetical protein